MHQKLLISWQNAKVPNWRVIEINFLLVKRQKIVLIIKQYEAILECNRLKVILENLLISNFLSYFRCIPVKPIVFRNIPIAKRNLILIGLHAASHGAPKTKHSHENEAKDIKNTASESVKSFKTVLA